MKYKTTLIFSLCLCNYSIAQTDSIQTKIQKFLNVENEVTLTQTAPTFKLPKIDYSEDVLIVTQEKHLPIPSFKEKVSLNVIFSLEGNLIRIESTSKDTVPDPWRKTVEDFEYHISCGKTEVYGIGKLSEEVTLDSVLKWTCKYYHLEEATEFSISLLDYKFHHKTIRENTLMLKAWGLKNPMPIFRDLPEQEVNRVRAFFNSKGNRISQSNYL